MMPDPDPIRVDLRPDGLHFDYRRLGHAMDALPAGAPVVAMIHGYSYAPGHRRHCPHNTILSSRPRYEDRRTISWPAHLGLDGKSGLGIAFGWRSRCGLWKAHNRAQEAGTALAGLASLVADRGRRLDVIAHSMGARVALSALSQALPGDFGRFILLAPAESRAAARAAMASPAGRRAEVVNVITRENDFFDALYEWGVHFGMRTSLGQGLGLSSAGWHDLWIDAPAAISALAANGFPLSHATRRICHWSPYLRPGIFALYRAILADDLPLTALPATRPARRWSRLVSPDMNVLGGYETAPLA